MSWRENVTKLLMGKVGGPWEGGIRAYHSSPHDFDRFDWSKLRTGEGANTFGAGFYAAENPAVSGQGGEYWQQFNRRFEGPEKEAADILSAHDFNRAEAAASVKAQADKIAELRKEGKLPSNVVGGYTDPVIIDSINRSLSRGHQDVYDLLASNRPIGPRTYEVNIAARPELMLDWDKPLHAQPPHVKDVLTKFGWEPDSYTLPGGALAPRIGGPTGEDAYKNLARQMHNRYGQTDRNIQSNYASQELAEAGIPGIRYLDQGSRGIQWDVLPVIQGHGSDARQMWGARQGGIARTTKHFDTEDAARQFASENTVPPTYNYVVTDPSKLDILGKYGVVGTAGGGMGVLAAQDQYGAQP